MAVTTKISLLGCDNVRLVDNTNILDKPFSSLLGEFNEFFCPKIEVESFFEMSVLI
jgi:hypothetical protein